MFEYVEKHDYQPIRIKVENVIRKVQKSLRKQGLLTFQYKLIGSAGKRHLITRVKNGNQGFDFDYNLELQQIDEDLFKNPKKIKELFIKEFDKYFDYSFESPEDSTSVFTIKNIDKVNSKINYGFDFAIVCQVYDNEGRRRQKYIRCDRNTNGYSWCLRKIHTDHSNVVDFIKANGLWNKVRDLYLENKNKEPNKKSRIVYYQTLDTIYKRNFQ